MRPLCPSGVLTRQVIDCPKSAHIRAPGDFAGWAAYGLAMTIVFVHGVPETSEVWDGVRARIDTDSVALMLPGFGCGRPDSFDATKDEYVAWLTAELRRIPGPIDLVGHDWGAVLSYRVITNSDIPLRSWVGDVASSMHADFIWHDLAQIWQTPETGEQFIRRSLASAADAPAGFAGNLRSLGVPDLDALRMDHHFDALMGESILALYRSAVPNPYKDWGREVGRTAAPGLIIHPANDPFDNRRLAEEVAEQLGATFHLLPDTGHFWMLENPVAAAATLTDFWDSLPN